MPTRFFGPCSFGGGASAVSCAEQQAALSACGLSSALVFFAAPPQPSAISAGAQSNIRFFISFSFSESRFRYSVGELARERLGRETRRRVDGVEARRVGVDVHLGRVLRR